MSYGKILVVAHGGDPDQPAVKRALELATDQSQVEIFAPVYNAHLEAYPLSDLSHYERLRDRMVERGLDQAGAIAAELKKRSVQATASAVWDYPYYEAIIRRAMAGDADLIISESLTQRAHALRYADWRLLAAAPVPVLLLKSPATEPYRSVVAAVDPFHRHDKPASLDEQILGEARRLSRCADASLRAVFCFVPLVHAAVAMDGEPLPIDDIEERLESEQREALNALLARADMPSDAGEIQAGKPEEVLPGLSADVLVLGAVSRGRLKDLILGSTAERILDETDSDLLVVKPAGFTTLVSHHVEADPVVNPVFYPF